MKEKDLTGRIILLPILVFISFFVSFSLNLIGAIFISFVIGLAIKKMSNEQLLRDRSPKVNGIEIFLAMELGFIPAILVTHYLFPAISTAISILCFLALSVIFFLLGRLTIHLSERKKQKTEK